MWNPEATLFQECRVAGLLRQAWKAEGLRWAVP